MLNSTILHYKILRRLGAGGMGEVFLAHDTKLDREIAIKVLKPASIMVTEDGTPKILDFGLARIIPPPPEAQQQLGSEDTTKTIKKDEDDLSDLTGGPNSWAHPSTCPRNRRSGGWSSSPVEP